MGLGSANAPAQPWLRLSPTMSKSFALPLLTSNSHLFNSNVSFLPPIFRCPSSLKLTVNRNLILCSTPIAANSGHGDPPKWIHLVATSAILFLGLGAFRLCPTSSALLLPPAFAAEKLTLEEDDPATNTGGNGGNSDSFEDEKLQAEFEAWKSKTFALTVPLNVVALRGSIPPSWVKEFMQSQGKRLKFRAKFVGSLEKIFSDLSASLSKQNVGPSSTVAADIVSVGDSWLSFAIKKALIEPIREVEEQDWFKGLNDKWKVYLRRNYEGAIDPEGKIWAAPYRWGCMVIAYKKCKFRKHKLAPIEDWADLWRPDLTGRISMVDSPREVVGAVLKYMGASYNTKNFDLQVSGGKKAVQQNLALLGKQVRLFDSKHYLKAFAVGDVWVAVGWSSDVLPVAKRMSNVAVVVPKSGASLWADLWAIPGASKLQTDQIGGRVRGASPLIHQWIEFCLQSARASPFKQEVIPGAIPSDLESSLIEHPFKHSKGKPRLDTNLVAGVPPPEILSRCEFLEPLSDAMLSDYKILLDVLQKSGPSMIHRIRQHMLSNYSDILAKATKMT